MKCCFTLLPLKLSHLCLNRRPSLFFFQYTAHKLPANQIAHSCLVSSSVSQAMVNNPPPPSCPPTTHTIWTGICQVFCFSSLPLSLSLPLTLFFPTGRSRAESQACTWHKTLNHRLPLSVNAVNVGLYCSILYDVLVCYIMLFCCRSVTTTAVNVILYKWFFSQCEIYEMWNKT